MAFGCDDLQMRGIRPPVNAYARSLLPNQRERLHFAPAGPDYPAIISDCRTITSACLMLAMSTSRPL